MNKTKQAVISIQADAADLPQWIKDGLKNQTVPKILAGAVSVVFENIKGTIKIYFEAAAKSIMVIYGKVKDAMPSSIIRRNACTVSTIWCNQMDRGSGAIFASGPFSFVVVLILPADNFF